MYSPFGKGKLSGIAISDIQYLIDAQIPEGLFIEYKSRIVNPKKIANSIASFANSYGGWYFVGIEADKITNAATAIVGVDPAESRDPVSTIRGAVKEYLSPPPVHFAEVVTSPLGLPIVVLRIPGNQQKPFISRDGRIYRRLADASDPIHENDRSTIDRLVEEGREVSRRFTKFCEDDRTYCQGESGDPWIHIYLRPFPDAGFSALGHDRASLEMLIKQINQKKMVDLGSDVVLTTQFTFETVSPTVDGVILSAKGGRGIERNSTQFEFFHNNWARIRIPLVCYRPSMLVNDNPAIVNPEVRRLLSSLLREESFHYIEFIDLKWISQEVFTLLEVYWSLLDCGDQSVEVEYKLEFSGMWRKAVFLDSPEWANHFETCGVSVMYRDSFKCPSSASPASSRISNSDTRLSIQVLVNVISALGATPDLVSLIFAQLLHSQDGIEL